ncbi:MAG: molybdate ABC transporter substrate-binding protein [Planctomycetaceae bacterium]
MRRGSTNSAVIGLAFLIGVLAVLGWFLFDMQRPNAIAGKKLVVYCAAGIRPAMQPIIDQYEREFDIDIDVQYAGSNSLLSQIDIARTGDIYIAADESYINMAVDRGIVREAIPVARQRPIIAIKKGNPKNISSVKDLLRTDVVTAMGNPDQAAVGKVTRRLLKASGQWKELESRIQTDGVFKPTVPEVANDAVLGHVDAAIIWDATITNYKDKLEAINVPELDAGVADIAVGVMTSSETPPRALHFARYVAAPSKGQAVLKAKGFETTPGDPWAEVPKLTFFCGAVNRRAVEPAIDAFKLREGADISVVYNGCGGLTGSMKTIENQNTDQGFPDTFMACDIYYLSVVQDWFEEGLVISDTDIVIVVPKGNPKNIQTLSDLTNDDVQIAVGQPEQCTIGVLTRRLLAAERIEDKVNIVTQTTSSSLLIPAVTEGAADAVLAYKSDTLAVTDQIDVIPIASDLSTAIQPFSIARSSKNKQLARRLFDAIATSRKQFEAAGFNWRLESERSE